MNTGGRFTSSVALTVDVEDYFNVEAFAGQVRREDWMRFPTRVERNTERLLELLAEHNTKATFFVLGWIAERYPSLVRRIAAQGHEVGCHSYWHIPLWNLSPKEFAADTQQAKAVLEDAVGSRVIGYRAPTFSVTRKTLWALGILADLGFEYDSSIFPIRHDRYGMPDAERRPHIWYTNHGQELLEFPLPTVRLARVNLPTGGGGYLRLLPFSWTFWALKHLSNNPEALVVLYLHPWEIDPAQPRLPCSRIAALRHYHNLDRTEDRLKRLLAAFKFAPLASQLEGYQRLRKISPVLTPSFRLPLLEQGTSR